MASNAKHAANHRPRLIPAAFLDADPHDAGGAGRPGHDAALGVEHEHGVADVVKQQAKALLAFPKPLPVRCPLFLLVDSPTRVDCARLPEPAVSVGFPNLASGSVLHDVGALDQSTRPDDSAYRMSSAFDRSRVFSNRRVR